MSRVRQFGGCFKTSHKAALLSAADHHKVGASVWKGKRLLSVGWNNTKTHPLSNTRYKAHHAEFSALIGNHKIDLIGATIMVTRLTPGQRLLMAKPCPECFKIIKAAGIARIYYTNEIGEIERDERL